MPILFDTKTWKMLDRKYPIGCPSAPEAPYVDGGTVTSTPVLALINSCESKTLTPLVILPCSESFGLSDITAKMRKGFEVPLNADNVGK